MADISTASRSFEQHGAQMAKSLEGAHRVTLQDVQFSKNAQYTIGLAVKEIAERCGLYVGEITKKLRGDMYWQEEDESLVIVFPVPEISADMMIEIPEGHWWFKGADVPSQ